MQRKNIDRLENEKDLVRQALSDKQRFAAIYDHYYPRIYNYIRLRVDCNAVEDLVSQVFEKAISKLEHYSPQKGEFSVWLFTIDVNTVRDHLRAQKRCVINFTATMKELAEVHEPNIEEKILQYETKDKLLDALKRLSIREQNIIALKFWWNLTNRRIAQMIGLDENNVAVILFRALKRLRKILTDKHCL
ncbi:MAG TPA: sigma-70 family RNA polymerase sigma factor [Bacillota bacterium]|nr:sigma-70 family RNA polymerase sigma factor [Peptococcaceae bacterium]HUM59487.1 sigma-70 family RNA polymerase sigma factor [Bacillota bacterium]